VAPDVVVRRCTLTVRGRGGWGWGTDPERYLALALPAIEQALDRVLGECDLGPDADLHLAEPVRLAWGRDGRLTDEAREALVERIRRAAEAARPAPPAAGQAPAGPATEPESEPEPAPPADADSAGGVTAVPRLLAEWSRSGRLPRIVAAWPAAVARRWLTTAATAATDPDAVELAEPAVAAIADMVLAPAALPAPDARAVDRLLVLIGALAAAAGDRPIGPATLDRAAARAGGVRSPPAGDAGRPAAPPAPAAGAEDTAAGGAAPGRPPPRPPRPSPRRAVPGLPFLVLVQLGRIGYLDAVWAAAAAAGDPRLARLAAAGLAGKVLPPPARGWRRRGPEDEAVALVAGLAAGEADPLAHAAAGQAELLLPPLQSALVALYAAGHSSGDEVVVSATSHGVVCGEAAGTLPIAWLPDGADPAPVLDQLGRPPSRWGGLFAPLAAELATRLAFPHADLPGLERHLGAAAGTALGSLAQELWGTGTADAPLLALDRLEDLEVEARPGRVLEVAVPRGQRWLDLRRAGLLDRWAVPWAAAGHWELVTW
jgi:hypothetical protein